MSITESPAEAFPPGEYLRDELAARGWSEIEFADILNRPAQAISEILNGKKEITPESAIAIGAALSTSPELWLNLQSTYRLFVVKTQTNAPTQIERRAQLRSLVPVRELQKRQWLPDTKDLDVLEAATCSLLGISDLSETPSFLAAARRTNEQDSLSPEQTAWLARVRVAGRLKTARALDLDGLQSFAAQLVHRISDPTDLGSLGAWLCDYGVVLTIVLPLKGSKIDGVVIWNKESDGPIIGLSTRYDRMDGLIFTLLHEIAHLVLGHVTRGCVRLDEKIIEGNVTGMEAEASDLAARWIIPEALGFDRGTKPSMQRIIAVASGLGIHPSFIIGRLQREGILDWADFRRSIPKVRPSLEVD